MEQIVVSKATSAHRETLQRIGRQTFRETFAQSNTEADMKKYLEESFGEERIGAELSNPESIFFIAWENGSPVGYLKLNSGSAQTELRDEAALEIERIYVVQACQGKSIGQLLYQKALDTARLLGKRYIWLAVWEENHKALRFYRKNGFVEFGSHIFRLGDDEQTDLMMKLVL